MSFYRYWLSRTSDRVILHMKSTHLKFISSKFSINLNFLIQTRRICSNSKGNIVDSFISTFTKQPCLESPELRRLSSELAPEIVESVLKSLKNWRMAQLFFNWASNQEGYSHNCYAYNAMASILSSARQIASLRDLANNLSSSKCYLTPGALGYFIRCLGSQGLVKEANDLFDQVKNLGICVPNSYSYNCLLEAISKSGDVGLMELRLNEMRDFGWQISKHTLTPVLQCYCNAGNFEKALGVYGDMKEQGWIDAHVLSILVVSFSKAQKVDMAFEIIDRMERDLKITLNEKTFCVLIHGFVKESRVDRALQLLDKMIRVGFIPDISIYDVLIGGLCKKKEIKTALMVCKKMKEAGISPHVKVVCKLLLCVEEEGDMISLLEILLADLHKEKRRLLYNSVLTGLVNISSVDKAFHLLKATIGDGISGEYVADKLFLVKENVVPDTTSFQIVIDGLCKFDKLEVAIELLRDMIRIGCKRSVLLYNNLIDSLSKADRLSECFHLFNEMKEDGFQPTHYTFNSIFGCLCRREDVNGATDMVRKMRAHGHSPWIKYYTLLVKKLCQHGRAVEARDFLADMTHKGFLPDMIAYSAVIDGFLKMNELDSALELFREICERGYCPDVVAYNIIINGLCKASRTEEAEVIVNEMAGKGLVPSVVTYNSMIDGWCKDGDINRAILYFSRMAEENLEPNVITYTTLVDGLCNAGKPDDALNLWVEMEDKGCIPNKIAYMALIHGLCKCERPDDALIYLQQMERKEMKPDAFIYKDLSDAFLSNSNTTRANEFLTELSKHSCIS